ncbi:MAG: hypothetical protein AAB969_01525 [Patescibacteria group bacterium]
MANITYVNEYVLLTFEHNSSSAVIYIAKPIGLDFFQIDMLESFFERIMFYCSVGSNIDINVTRLKNEEVNIIGYFYNKNQNYDFCGTFDNVFIAIHNALSAMFYLSVNNEFSYGSVNSDLEGEGDYYDDETGESDEEGQEESPPKKTKDKRQEKKLRQLGQAIDEILGDQDDKNGNR